jgi:Uma2 family endonuclease
MARHIEDEVVYYYDSHSTQEDLMGETAFHAALVRYLVDVLTWLFQGQLCAIYENLNFYQTANTYEYPLAPDVAVIKGVAYQLLTRSWRVGKSGPAPQVVFEIASEETWKKDLEEKPAKYARMGVQEYFAYDPHEFPLPPSNNRRLFGWRLDQDRQTMKEMSIGPNGSLWSPSLESWLVPDGTMLRLYDRNGQMGLTYGEAEAQQKLAEARRAEALAEKLRSLGIDPDQIV